MTWIALIVTLQGQHVASIPFPDAMACGEAMPGMHEALLPSWPDAMLQ